jgi:hypothetical protein
MGGLINEILARLKLILELQTVTVWNNQFNYLENGGDYSFGFPCAFVEVDTIALNQISYGVQGSDLPITIHIGQVDYNGNNISENLTIFTLRDLIVKSFAKFKPTTGSVMVKISEEQDFEHSNFYHYKITFNTHFIDLTTKETEYYTTSNPTTLNITLP